MKCITSCFTCQLYLVVLKIVCNCHFCGFSFLYQVHCPQCQEDWTYSIHLAVFTSLNTTGADVKGLISC